MDAAVTAPWWSQGFTVLDIESTDKDPETALTASICFGLMRAADASMQVRTALVAVDMPAEASAVNGLTTEQLRAEGGKPAEVLDDFCAEIAVCLTAGMPLVIMNAPYDLTVLDRDCRRNGVPTITDRLEGRPLAPIIDPGVLDKKVIKYRRRVSETQGARCLKTLAQVHGVGWDDEQAHTAEYDATRAGRVAWQLMARFPALAAMTLPELHDAQIGWYREQSEGLAAFWRQKANEIEHRAARDDDEAAAEVEKLRTAADGVSLEWPMRTVQK
ncbi:DNA polymerase-3 subunit epsilon [Micromonospora pisi]|uniref:DNA polymerase-3 subunit epsilon n=1 Tax=Micromonospora pisi TaxID=589240 RepID=A0A495JX57_9ACTN|nr:exonuclease domain-containing protein [Micromonospora pisi]RKR92844.1 DNA polymerase-3 subunit epsilon [Micromonospora pisi]